jgi:hypothetical protein
MGGAVRGSRQTSENGAEASRTLEQALDGLAAAVRSHGDAISKAIRYQAKLTHDSQASMVAELRKFGRTPEEDEDG